jgi:hypothetical protein
MIISQIYTGNTITLFIKGESRPRIIKTDSRKNEIFYMVDNINSLSSAGEDFSSELEQLIKIISPIKYVATKHSSLVIGEDGRLYLVGTERPIFGYLSTKILEFLDEGLPIDYLIEFWKNCLANPRQEAVEELFDFLSASSYPITSDGCFIGYKKVQSIKNSDSSKFNGLKLDKQGNVRDSKGHFVGNPLRQEYIDFLENREEAQFVDSYSGTIKQSIGDVVSIPREQCDFDRTRTCSKGLHVGSYEYSKGFSGDVFIHVLVNPRDVVSVPTDYSNGKLRCCQYTILGYATEEPLEIKVLD